MMSEAGGWFAIMLFVPYLAIWLAHTYVHWRASGNLRRRIMFLMAGSHFSLLVAFLLQWDIGDGESGWLTITVLLKNGRATPLPQWWPQGSLVNLLVFIPEVALLILLCWATRRKGTDETLNANS
jgi:hypothetical protein